jgi:hypothetical protein
MTEEEWLACTDPKPMLEFLRAKKASHRKLRLFAVACCRRFRHLLVPEACEALEVAEKVAEGLVGSEERRRVREMAFQVGWVRDPSTAHRRGPAKAAVCDSLARRAWEAAALTAWRTSKIGAMEAIHSFGGDWSAAKEGQDVLLAECLRCFFGNPLRPITLDPAWLTPKVKTLTQAIYDDRAFERMPELADALAEASCSNQDILSHCRGPGPHVRGCWVVDLVLGKE